MHSLSVDYGAHFIVKNNTIATPPPQKKRAPFVKLNIRLEIKIFKQTFSRRELPTYDFVTSCPTLPDPYEANTVEVHPL